MDPISNRPSPAPSVTQTGAAAVPEPAAKRTSTAQQAPQGSGFPDSADGRFDFPLLTAPRLGGLDAGSLLQAMTISLEKTELSTAKQDMKDHIAGVKRYADARADFLSLRSESITRLKEAEQTIANFKSGVEADLAAAQSDKAAIGQEIAALKGQLDAGASGPARAEIESKLSAAQSDLAVADSRIQSAQNALDRLDISPAEADRVRCTALVIAGAGLDSAERDRILSAAVSGGAIPVDLIGQLAGPDAKAAAERAATGLSKLTAPVAGSEGSAVTYAAMVDGGGPTHPVETAFLAISEPDGPDKVLGRILSALYRTGEVNDETQDVLEQIAATVDVVAQRFSGREEVDEDLKLNFRNKMSI